MVDSSEISIVVQGAIARDNDLTARCLLSIRKHLPKSEIILSTWKNSDIRGLSFDKSILSDDPGGVLQSEYKGKKVYSNTNRQIVSTKAGLSVAERKYAIKFRTDLLFKSTNFLRYFSLYEKKNPLFNFLEKRVIVSSNFTPNPNRLASKPFHPSDWFTFGLTHDVRKVWDIPLAPEPDNSLWFASRSHPTGVTERDSMRYRHEQYIWLSFLRNYVEIPCEHQWDYGGHNRELHELSFANNLIILSPEQIGIRFMKYGIGIGGWVAFYTHYEWQELYKKYCCPRFLLSVDEETQFKMILANAIRRSPRLEHVINWFDYRYNRVTAAWNSERRWTNLWNLVTKANDH